jgi:hypothetical protein
MDSIKSFNEIDLTGLKPTKTVIFCDIDNTLTRLCSKICSDEWVKWQVSLHLNDPKSIHTVGSNLYQFYDYYSKWMNHYKCRVKLIEDCTPDLYNEWTTAGYRIILITARNKRLTRLTIDQLSTLYDLSKLNQINCDKINLINGICFTAGTNKGVTISKIINILPKIDNVVFIDDSERECNNVCNQFSQSKLNVKVYLYTACHPKVAKFMSMDKSNLTEIWNQTWYAIN